tara:strand:- start:231 stop:404 length:174 start_codon:yes stop_codon:yes gene_type:complete
MLLTIKKFYTLLKYPLSLEDELIFNWRDEKITEVKTNKTSFKCIDGYLEILKKFIER